MIVGLLALSCLGAALALAPALTVPNEVQQPGTQPNEIGLLTSSDTCSFCHGDYDEAIEPAHNWRGSMMAHASVDPVFWAALAIAEQDFDGSGDLCVRCHIPIGWLDGRSTPTDGSSFADDDAEGVSCHVCHRLTNPDESEHIGVQNAPFVANDGGAPAEGFYGSGMYVLNSEDIRLGPYSDAAAPHLFDQSQYHRSSNLCGTCHDVSNPVVGDLAHNNGSVIPLAPGTFSGVIGSPVSGKAAFNNPPHAYGVVERTFSEHQSSAFATMHVSQYTSLPADLQAGSIKDAYDAATAVRPDGKYADGADRLFSCQTCHMKPVQGVGCRLGGSPVRQDLPLHDLTGGNYWAPDAITYLDTLGRLHLGTLQTPAFEALEDGKARARHNLTRSASLIVDGNSLRVVNLTGHKLITGYPEGRRMWLHITWTNGDGVVVREDGAYGALNTTINGFPAVVETILDPSDPNLRTYEAHHGMTQEWAAQLIGLGRSASIPLMFDRVTGAVTETLGGLAAMAPGTEFETFHFVLNNTVLKDSRIPPYGLSYDSALERNALPTPSTQFGNPGPGGTFDYFDIVALTPPAGAAAATIELLYQPTSWEYIQFLDLANDGVNPELATVGDDLLEAWLNTGMAEPAVMATAVWSESVFTYGFCTGTGTCNNPDPAAGCSNSTGSGCALVPTGSASLLADDLVLTASGLPAGQVGLLIAGKSTGLTGFRAPFGDGQYVLGSSDLVIALDITTGTPTGSGVLSYNDFRRLGSGAPGAPGSATWGPGFGLAAGFGAGETVGFQVMYRDVAGPCMNGFNLSNGVQVTFEP